MRNLLNYGWSLVVNGCIKYKNKEKMAIYEKDGFETRLVKEERKFLLYTRRVVTEIVLEEGRRPL